jgi:hypothetical protein
MAEFAPESPPDEQDLGASIERLDESRNAFLDRAFRYSKIPTLKARDSMIESLTDLAGCFQKSVKIILESEDDPEFKSSALQGLFVNEDQARVNGLNQIAGIEICNPLSDEEIEALTTFCEDSSRSSKQFLERFGKDAEVDINNFIDRIKTDKRARLLYMGKVASNHLFDLGKITAGAALGAYLIKRLDRA